MDNPYDIPTVRVYDNSQIQQSVVLIQKMGIIRFLPNFFLNRENEPFETTLNDIVNQYHYFTSQSATVHGMLFSHDIDRDDLKKIFESFEKENAKLLLISVFTQQVNGTPTVISVGYGPTELTYEQERFWSMMRKPKLN